MSPVHPSAQVADGAKLGDGVEIGPFSVIGPDVTLGEGTRIHSHVVITGHTTLGPGCQVHPFVTLGEPPQDTKYGGEPTRLEIGASTLIREQVTIHRGTPHGGGVTRIGSNCFFMVNVHVAHDCIIGDRVVLINQATLAGHCEIGTNVVIGATSVVQQFTRIGGHAYIAATSGVRNDVIPFGVAKGNRQDCTLQGLNLVGLKQRGFPRDEIRTLREAYRMIFEGPTYEIGERAARARDSFAGCAPVLELANFVLARPDRNLCLPGQSGSKSVAETV